LPLETFLAIFLPWRSRRCIEGTLALANLVDWIKTLRPSSKRRLNVAFYRLWPALRLWFLRRLTHEALDASFQPLNGPAQGIKGRSAIAIPIWSRSVHVPAHFAMVGIGPP
jgi:hypothetical protein